MLSSALGWGGGVFETGVMFGDGTAGDGGTAPVIFIRFPSDGFCCSGLGDGAEELGVLVPPVCDWEEAGIWGARLGIVDELEAVDSAAPSSGEGAVGFPSFARSLLRI